MFAIVDVETTGLRAQSEKITELAILIHNGKQITNEYITLINPEKEIPFRIINLTGINNKIYRQPQTNCPEGKAEIG